MSATLKLATVFRRPARLLGALCLLAGAWLAAARACPAAGAPDSEREEVRLLDEFERRETLEHWKATSRSLSNQYFSRGDYSLEWNPAGARGAAFREDCLLSTRYRALFQDWEQYEELRFDLKSDGDEPVLLALRLQDLQSDPLNPATGFVRYLTIRPGENLVALNLRDLTAGDGGRRLLLGNLCYLELELLSRQKTRLFLDGLRLVRPGGWPLEELRARRLRLDCGGAEALTFPGCLPLTPQGVPGQPALARWSGPAPVARAAEGGRPDRLAGDWLEVPVAPSATPRAPTALRLALPAGKYRARALLRKSPPRPGRPSRIAAGGQELFRRANDAGEFLAADGLYHYAAADLAPAPSPAPLWERYVGANELQVELDLEAADDGVTLELENVALGALVLFPAEEAAALAEEARRLVRDRQPEFTRRHFVLDRPPRPPLPSASEFEKKQGCYYFQVYLAEAFSAYYVPRESRLLDEPQPAGAPAPARSAEAGGSRGPPRVRRSFEAEIARGETVWIGLGLHPFRPVEDLKITLDQPICLVKNVKLPAEALQLFAARSRPAEVAPGIWSLRPSVLVPVTGESLGRLEPGYSYAFWLRVRLPAEDPGLEYRGAVRFGGMAEAFPLALHVCPFELAPLGPDCRCGFFFRDPQEANQRFGDFPDQAAGGAAELRRELRDLVAHGFNTFTLSAPRLTQVAPDGTVTLDFGRLDELLVAAREAGLELAGRIPMRLDELPGELIARGGLAFSEIPFEHAWRSALAQIQQWAEQRRLTLLGILVFDPSEFSPGLPGRPQFEQAKRLLSLAREVHSLRGAVLLSTAALRQPARPEASLNAADLLAYTDDLLTVPWADARSLRAAAVPGQGRELWLAAGGFDRFSFGFLPFALGARGRLQLSYLDCGPADDPLGALRRPTAVCPGPDGPLATLDYERAAAGVADLRYLQTLELAKRQAREDGDNEGARRAEDTLQRLRELAQGRAVAEPPLQYLASDGRPPLWWDAPEGSGTDDLDDWRHQAITEIMRLKKLERPILSVPGPAATPAPPGGRSRAELLKLILPGALALLVLVAGLMLIKILRYHRAPPRPPSPRPSPRPPPSKLPKRKS